jgi:hypothetical protein
MVRFRVCTSLVFPVVVFGSGDSGFLVDKNINESESLNDIGIQKPELLTQRHKLLTQKHKFLTQNHDSDSEISKSESPESDHPQSAPPPRPRPFPRAARYFARLETTGKSKLCADCTFGGVHYYNSDETKRYGMVSWLYGPREVPKEEGPKEEGPKEEGSKERDNDGNYPAKFTTAKSAANEYSKHVASDSAHNDIREDTASTVLGENLKLNVDAASDADAAADAFRARVKRMRSEREGDGDPDEQVLPRHDFTDVFLGNRKEMFLITNPHDETPGPALYRNSNTNTHTNTNTHSHTQIDTNANSGSAKQEKNVSSSKFNSANINSNSAASTSIGAPALGNFRDIFLKKKFPRKFRTSVAPFQCLRVTDYYDNVFDYNWDAEAKYVGVEWFHHKLCKRWDNVMPFFIQVRGFQLRTFRVRISRESKFVKGGMGRAWYIIC